MRITNNMISATFLNGLNKTLNRQNTLQEQMADGKAVHRPSDDPAKVARSLSLKSNLALNEQYTTNAKIATSWMDTTDSAMSDLSSALIEAQTLVTSADGSKTPSDLHMIGTQLDGLINSIVQIGNSQMGDRYLFGGHKDKTQPLTRTTVLDAQTNLPTEVIVYNGDNNKISMPVKNGVVNAAQDSVNLTGIDVFGPAETIDTTDASGKPKSLTTLSVLNDLLRIKDELMKPTPDVNWLSNVGLAKVQAGHDTTLQAQTELGARNAAYRMMTNLLADSNTALTGALSANEDVDVAKAITDMKTTEAAYNAALAVGAKILPVSLVDFMR